MTGTPAPRYNYSVLSEGRTIWGDMEYCADFAEAREKARSYADRLGHAVTLRRTATTRTQAYSGGIVEVTHSDTEILPTAQVKLRRA